ncbi:MAG: YceI family protein [Verrucomicrobiota bacterium]
MKPIHLTLLFSAPLYFASCENPADKTTDAKVGEAVEKSVSAGEGVKYVFAPESKVNFTGSKVTGSHAGGFKSFTGHFTIKDGEPVGNDHKVVIDMKTTWSDTEKLTGHLKTADFFDVEKYPKSTFDVTGVEKDADSSYKISGNFTFHGVTKNISFPATVLREGGNVRIRTKFDINRKDFGVNYPGKADDAIRDQVVIELDLLAKPEA